MSQFPAKAQAENCLWKNLFKNVLACIIDEVHCVMDWDKVLSTGCINKMYLILLLKLSVKVERMCQQKRLNYHMYL